MAVNRNRLGNVHNSFQGGDTKVLCVCSAGLLRSPTMVKVLLQRFKGMNPRAVGTSSDFALIPLDLAHLMWAEVILCADDSHKMFVESAMETGNLSGREVHSLKIPDDFSYGDPVLEDMIEAKVAEIFAVGEDDLPKSWFAEKPAREEVTIVTEKTRLWE
jgi:predicted protein tyrosine phosphatase